jgi:RNA polymerase sigma-70 factor (ECF subfamily)
VHPTAVAGVAVASAVERRRSETTMPERSEPTLVASVLAGNLDAFEELLQPYESRVYQVVLRILRNPDETADVYQEAVLTAFEKLADFRGTAAFGTWLHRIAVNCALMRRRSNRRSPIVQEADPPQFNWMGMHAQPVRDWAESPESAAQRTEMRRALLEALDTLPEVDRAIVWMKDAEGMTHDDIAAATGLSVAAARTRLHRARIGLRARLQHYWGGER